MGHVYYHHPGDKQFSLDFVHPDPDEIVSQIVGYGDDAAVKVRNTISTKRSTLSTHPASAVDLFKRLILT